MYIFKRNQFHSLPQNPSFEIEIDRPDDGEDVNSNLNDDLETEENDDAPLEQPSYNEEYNKPDYNQTYSTVFDHQITFTPSKSQPTSSVNQDSINTISSKSPNGDRVLRAFNEDNQTLIDQALQSYNQTDSAMDQTQELHSQYTNEEQLPFHLGTSNISSMPTYNPPLGLPSNFMPTNAENSKTKNALALLKKSSLKENKVLHKSIRKDKRKKTKHNANKVVKVYVFTCGHACSQCNSDDAMDWLQESGIHTAQPQSSDNPSSDLQQRSTPYIVRPSSYSQQQSNKPSQNSLIHRALSMDQSNDIQKQMKNKVQTSAKNVWRTICLPKPITVSLHDPDEQEIGLPKRNSSPKKKNVKSSHLKGTEHSDKGKEKSALQPGLFSPLSNSSQNSTKMSSDIPCPSFFNSTKNYEVSPPSQNYYDKQAGRVSSLGMESFASSIKDPVTAIISSFTGQLANNHNVRPLQTTDAQNIHFDVESDSDVRSYVPVMNNSGNFVLVPASMDANAAMDDPNNPTFVVNMAENSIGHVFSDAEKSFPTSDIVKSAPSLSSLLKNNTLTKSSGSLKQTGIQQEDNLDDVVPVGYKENNIVPVGLFTAKSMKNQYPQGKISDDSFMFDDLGVSQNTLSRL